MNKKQYLKQGYRLKKELEHDKDMLKELRQNLDGLKAIQLSEKVQGGQIPDDSKMIARMDKIIELEKKINTELCDLIDFKNELLEKLKLIKDNDERMLLEKRYILNEKWEEIAEKLYCSVRQVYRLHRKALENFNII